MVNVMVSIASSQKRRRPEHKALEKRFRVTNLTGAMKTALSQLKLECLSDLPEFKEDVMAALIKIREAGTRKPRLEQALMRSLFPSLRALPTL